MDRSIAWRAAAVQTVAVAVLSVALAVTLPHSFFDDWGWLAGPGAWAACSLLTAAALRLPIASTLLGAALAGVPSVVAVIVGAHWLGAAIAIACFAAWCGALAERRGQGDGRGSAAMTHPTFDEAGARFGHYDRTGGQD